MRGQSKRSVWKLRLRCDCERSIDAKSGERDGRALRVCVPVLYVLSSHLTIHVFIFLSLLF